MASFYYYSITDLADNTEYDSASILTVDGEKIHEFGRRVLKENGMVERTAVVYPFGGDSKAYAPSKEVGSFLPSSGTQDRPFVVHLKTQQQPVSIIRVLLLNQRCAVHIVDVDSCVLILMAAADYIPDDIFR